MKRLIISDIHANLAAFEAVLADAEGEWEEIWCLGDLVGYGPDPNECVALLRQHEHTSLSGNHDWAVLGRLDIRSFNDLARRAISWTQSQLNGGTRAYLETLPASRERSPFTLAHGSPRQPVWEYILDRRVAAANFSHFTTPYCLVGHTHIPVLYEKEEGDGLTLSGPVYGPTLSLDGRRLIINPGSVGQPRDSDPRAAYALLDSDELTWQFRRVEYPIEVTQERMRQAGLPDELVNRLSFGW